MPSSDARVRIEERARQYFDVVRFTSVSLQEEHTEQLNAFLMDGRHASMDWLARNSDRRADPKKLWPEAKSIVVVGMNYGPDHDPLLQTAKHDRATISVYAQNEDYHDVIKKKLKQLAQFVTEEFGAQVKVFVDTAPVMEKPLAQNAGLGWQGKHTNLVSRDYGSWLFLASLFTDLELETDSAETDHCGGCHRCLDICPTNAFSAPYQIDPRRCISYLTIENKKQIPREFRKAIGNRIYGCDDCLAVCPWNKFASKSRETRFHARDDLADPPLITLLELDDSAFRAMFRGSPIKRIGRDRFIRNVLIAVGNSGDLQITEHVKPLLNDDSALVRGAAVWALSQLLDAPDFALLAETHQPTETDEDVLQEWVLISS